MLEKFKRIRKDPIEFLKAVYTQDQVDKENPIKKFPWELEFIQAYCKVWVAKEKLAVPKSRRMKMSWINIILYLWDTMFNVGRHNAFVSKKEEGSDDLINRAEFVYDNLDPEIIPRELLPRKKRKFGLLEFPEINSKLQGFPQGADQLRQFTLSGIMADEMAFWEQAEEAYSASIPTLEGGGRFTAISSPAPGFFKRLVFDQLDKGEGDVVKTDSKFKKIYPMEGVEVWKNPKNEFIVFQLHYRADPNKRSEEFKRHIKSSMPRAQYMQEYEMSWESWAGFPVYPDFTKAIHTSKTRLMPQAGLPLLRGWDFGLTPACVVGQLQENKLVIFKEYVQINMGADRFTDLVLDDCSLRYLNWGRRGFMDFIDPSGEFRKDTDEGTCAKIMDSKGLRPIPGALAWEERRQSVEYFLTRFLKIDHDPTACLVIDDAECPMLIKGFEGGYRYADKAGEIEPSKLRPIKDEHSHVHDALQYLCSRVRMSQRKRKTPIPNLRYGFMNGGRYN